MPEDQAASLLSVLGILIAAYGLFFVGIDFKSILSAIRDEGADIALSSKQELQRKLYRIDDSRNAVVGISVPPIVIAILFLEPTVEILVGAMSAFSSWDLTDYSPVKAGLVLVEVFWIIVAYRTALWYWKFSNRRRTIRSLLSDNSM